MSSFRGARRLLSIGCRSIKCNQLHQRRIVSLGLTSLCQVTMKKQALFDTSALPVNKFDLSSVGILSPTLSSLFSTTTALVDDDANEVTEEDKEAGRLAKQISKGPLRKNTRKNSVFIGGYGFNHDRKYLHSIFKQFGDIYEIVISKENTYNQSLCDPEEFRFGFVLFKNPESVRNALTATTVTGFDGKIIEIKERTETWRTENELSFVVSGFSEDTNIHQIHDYFKSFGDVQSINLILKSGEDNNRNFAVVLYKEGSSVKFLRDQEHHIAGSKLMVEQTDIHHRREESKSRGRCKMILLSGISGDVTVEEVQNHFNGIGSVSYVSLQKGVVYFHNKEAAISAAGLCLHEIGTSHVKAHLLGIVNE